MSLLVFQIGSFTWAVVSHPEIVKWCIPENNLFGPHDHTNEFIHSFRLCVDTISLYSYLWYPIFLNYFTLSQLSLFFYHNPLQMINLWAATRFQVLLVILIHTIDPLFGVMLLDNNNRSDESMFLLDESIFVFPD